MYPIEASQGSADSKPRRSLASEAGHFLQFGLSGLPAFVVALGLNKFLVEFAGWPKPVAYLLVVWMQMNIGFLMCHLVAQISTSAVLLLVKFMSAKAIFRSRAG
ncbi:MAG TPA: hypothetical protein VH351_08020 [Bryobacteraceae bacterium]|jgi:hypothetical protein|nr:hypothetical protein [Bryobacteraceae bacterium]